MVAWLLWMLELIYLQSNTRIANKAIPTKRKISDVFHNGNVRMVMHVLIKISVGYISLGQVNGTWGEKQHILCF